MHIKLLNKHMTLAHLGPFLPNWMEIAEQNRKPISITLNTLYSHGGGWTPFHGFTLNADSSITYPGDPPLHPLAAFIFEGLHEGEIAYFYPHDWVGIVNAERKLEICRMD